MHAPQRARDDRRAKKKHRSPVVVHNEAVDRILALAERSHVRLDLNHIFVPLNEWWSEQMHLYHNTSPFTPSTHPVGRHEAHGVPWRQRRRPSELEESAQEIVATGSRSEIPVSLIDALDRPRSRARPGSGGWAWCRRGPSVGSVNARGGGARVRVGAGHQPAVAPLAGVGLRPNPRLALAHFIAGGAAVIDSAQVELGEVLSTTIRIVMAQACCACVPSLWSRRWGWSCRGWCRSCGLDRA